LVDPREVDDLAAVRAEKIFRIETVLHRVERAEELRLRAVEVHARVVTLAFQESDRFYLDEPAAVAVAHEDLVLRRQAATRRRFCGGAACAGEFFVQSSYRG